MPKYLDEEMKGTCEACGKKAKARCTECKATYYCGRECQRSMYNTHKKECPVEKAIASCLNAAETNPEMAALHSRRVPDNATCVICLGGQDDSDEILLHQGCACRGTSGYAHVRCVFDHKLRNTAESLGACFTCKQAYDGEFMIRIAAACWRQHRRIDVLSLKTRDQGFRWTAAYANIANQFTKFDFHELSILMQKTAWLGTCRMFGPTSAVADEVLVVYAVALLHSGQLDDARSLLEPRAAAWRHSDDTGVRCVRLNILKTLADTLLALGDAKQAESHLKAGLSDLALRTDDISMRVRRGFELSLIYVLDSVERYQEAFDLVTRNVEEETRDLGPDHPVVRVAVRCRENLRKKILLTSPRPTD